MRWLNALKPRLDLNDEERQALTTWAMLGGVAALTFAVGLMVYVLRYSWPESIVAAHAPLLIGGLFNVVYGLLGMMVVMIVAQAVIAIGGKMKASIGAASIEAEAEAKVTVRAQEGS
jgi:hypothetical protein